MSDDGPRAPPGDLPVPPREMADGAGRSIELREGSPDDREALVEMYVEFDPADRAQGIPPGGEQRVRDWLEAVLGEESVDVVATHGGDVVGHGMLVPDGEGAYEVALFVLQAYQGAGIGTELLGTMLGLARSRGIERVWLTVERWNDAALAVYEKLGFERIERESTDRVGSGSFELEMAMRLD